MIESFSFWNTREKWTFWQYEKVKKGEEWLRGKAVPVGGAANVNEWRYILEHVFHSSHSLIETKHELGMVYKGTN